MRLSHINSRWGLEANWKLLNLTVLLVLANHSTRHEWIPTQRRSEQCQRKVNFSHDVAPLRNSENKSAISVRNITHLVLPFNWSLRSPNSFNSTLSRRRCSQHLDLSSIQFDCNPLLSSLRLLIISPPFSRPLHSPYQLLPLCFFCPQQAASVHFDYSSQARTVDRPSDVFYLLTISGIPWESLDHVLLDVLWSPKVFSPSSFSDDQRIQSSSINTSHPNKKK